SAAASMKAARDRARSLPIHTYLLKEPRVKFPLSRTSIVTGVAQGGDGLKMRADRLVELLVHAKNFLVALVAARIGRNAGRHRHLPGHFPPVDRGVNGAKAKGGGAQERALVADGHFE